MFVSPSKGTTSMSSLCGGAKETTANASPLGMQKAIKETEGDSPIRKYNIRMKNAMLREDVLPSKCLEEMKGGKPGSRPMERLNSLLRASSSHCKEQNSQLDKRSKGGELQNASALSVESANTPQRKSSTAAHRSATSRTSEALQYSKLLKPEAGLIKKLLGEEKDQRYRYLLKQGNLHFIEAETMSLYVQLPQIPNILIVYRRPMEREHNPEKQVSEQSRMNLESRMLSHVPLLEGEEKLKSMHLQNNEIGKIQNLVSLPNLNFLDFSLNRLHDISSLSSVPSLRVLMLGRNQITHISGLEGLVNLDVLDLHDNKIYKIQGLTAHIKLRVLNLSQNCLTKLENYSTLVSLVELNLRKNQISDIEETPPPRRPPLANLQKLYLSQNKLKTVTALASICPNLAQLSLQDNPVDRSDLPVHLAATFIPKLKIYNFQPVPDGTSALKKNNEEAEKIEKKEPKETNKVENSKVQKHIPAQQVIEVIQKEWEKEMSRLRERQNGGAKGEKSHVHSGHAQIEGNHALYIYGNALEVLGRTEFYSQVDEIHFNYVRFDLLVYHVNLDKLKRFHKLNKLYFHHNNLTSLIFLSKLESLAALNSLTILQNQILATNTLRSFVVYRFQNLQEFNSTAITERDRKIAKQQFQLFDKILSISNVLTQKPNFTDANAKQEYRQRAKKHAEFSQKYVEGIVENQLQRECVRGYHNFDLNFQRAVGVIIENSLENIDTDHWYGHQMGSLERAMQRALAK